MREHAAHDRKQSHSLQRVECELVTRPHEGAHRGRPGRHHIRDKSCSPKYATTKCTSDQSKNINIENADGWWSKSPTCSSVTSGSGRARQLRDATPMTQKNLINTDVVWRAPVWHDIFFFFRISRFNSLRLYFLLYTSVESAQPQRFSLLLSRAHPILHNL